MGDGCWILLRVLELQIWDSELGTAECRMLALTISPFLRHLSSNVHPSLSLPSVVRRSTHSCHPAVSAAAAEQVNNLVHLQCSIAFHEPYLRLIEKLLPVMPHESLDQFFFWNSGEFLPFSIFPASLCPVFSKVGQEGSLQPSFCLTGWLQMLRDTKRIIFVPR